MSNRAMARFQPLGEAHPIIKELLAERKAQGHSARGLAPYVGINNAVLLRTEAGKSDPRLSIVSFWADALGLELTLRKKS